MGSDKQINKFSNGNIYGILYHKKGNTNCWHNPNGPARIYYYENGNKEREYWFINDQMHRTNGPAHIRYYENGDIKAEYWYINNKVLSTEEIYNIKKELKFNEFMKKELS